MSGIIYKSKKVLPYVYLATNRITGEFYIGYREANKVPSTEDIGITYFSSSKKVKPFYDQFEYKVIAEFFTGEDAFLFEQEYIQEHIRHSLCLNGYVNHKFYCGGSKSEEHRQKIGAAHQGKPKKISSIKKLKEWRKNNPMTDEAKKELGQKISLAYSNKSEEEIEQWKEKISIANTGRIKSEEEIEKIRLANLGKPKSEEHRQKIGDVHRGKTISEEQKAKMSNTLSNGNHWKAATWVLQSPNGEIHTTKAISNFCKKHSLTYSVLRYKAQKKNTNPVLSGPSKDWIVLDRYF